MSNLVVLGSFVYALVMSLFHAYRIDHGMHFSTLASVVVYPFLITTGIAFVLAYVLFTFGLYSYGGQIRQKGGVGGMPASVPDNLKPPV